MCGWRGRRESHLLEDVGRGHEAEADGLDDGVRVSPAAAVVPEPRLDRLIQLDLGEAAQRVALQVRLVERGKAGRERHRGEQ